MPKVRQLVLDRESKPGVANPDEAQQVLGG